MSENGVHMPGFGPSVGPGIEYFVILVIFLAVLYVIYLLLFPILTFLSAFVYSRTETLKKSKGRVILSGALAVFAILSLIPQLGSLTLLMVGISNINSLTGFLAAALLFILSALFLAISFQVFRMKIVGKRKSLLWALLGILPAELGFALNVTGQLLLVWILVFILPLSLR